MTSAEAIESSVVKPLINVRVSARMKPTIWESAKAEERVAEPVSTTKQPR
jgi:hypothetical protein